MNGRRHPHYFKAVPTKEIDVYRVLRAFEVSDPGVQHAVKKCLMAGKRGTKNFHQDIMEAYESLSRTLEMNAEDMR